MFRQPLSFITLINKNLSALYANASSGVVIPKLRTLRGTPLPLKIRQFSCVAQRKEEYLISMESTPEKKAAGGQQEPRGEETSKEVRKQAAAAVTGNKSVKKAQKVRNLKKARERKKKEKETEKEFTQSLMNELPFADAECWTELGFTGGESNPKEKKKSKRKRADKGKVDSEDGEKETKKKKDSPRPNYFVSIPITNQKIKQAVEEVQAEVLKKDARISRALIPVGSLHITLLVTHLATQEEIDTASVALEEVKPTVMSLLSGRSLILPFCGIGHFRNEVAFVQIKDREALSLLSSIADSVRRVFEERGVSPGDQRDFKPHLTFLKLSRAPKLRRLGVKKLDTALYAEFEDREFGEERVCTLDLCSMLKKKSADGYYHCEKTVTFSSKRGPELDDEELVSLSKRLVEDAVLRAVQQYMEETQQNGAAQKDEAPPLHTSNNK
ncbi:A-kinase anchor protein 7-like [Hoplias malabaricus]|uniref:A-kinase anchor protein 7-like n=1 Tax=Hoplias malabaricus TaxID=27720 RepID=UPI003461E34D